MDFDWAMDTLAFTETVSVYAIYNKRGVIGSTP
jgi:hypothetical protein